MTPVRQSKFLLLCAAVCLSLMPATAQTADTIQFDFGAVSGNPGDTVEIPITMNAGATQASTFILWLRYDTQKLIPDDNYYQFTQSVPGSTGSPTVTTSFARPETAVTTANKFVETNITQPGTLVVLVAGAPSSTVADGLVLTLAFTINPAVLDGDSILIEGIMEGDPGEQVVSSAADSSSPTPLNIPVNISDGVINVGCSPASSVNGVGATTDRSDGVLISWNGIPETGAQYRVYRNTVNNAATAKPIGTTWQTATTYLDISAAVPTVNDPGGCFNPADVTPATYFYWVLARSASGCVSENYSTPVAQGSRAYAGKSLNTGLVLEKNLPAKRVTAGAFSVSPGSPIAIRLDDGDSMLNPDSVGAYASAGEWQSEEFFITPANESGALWVSVNLPDTLLPGERIRFEAAANTLSGETVGPIVVEYVVDGGASKTRVVPNFPEAVGDAYQSPGEGVYASPQTVLLPLPDSYSSNSLTVYYFAEDESGGAWVPAENVDGLLVAAETVDANTGKAIAVTLRHSAVLQLGTPPKPEAPKQKDAALMSIGLSPRHLADLLMFLLVVAFFASVRVKGIKPA